MSETKFKKYWLKNWGRWYECYEPNKGSGVGIPDVQILCDDFQVGGAGLFHSSQGPRLLPIEFKIGEIVDGKLICKKVRPDQIGWHRRFAEAGGVSLFCFGVQYEGGWQSYYLKGSYRDCLRSFKTGVDLRNLYKGE